MHAIRGVGSPVAARGARAPAAARCVAAPLQAPLHAARAAPGAAARAGRSTAALLSARAAVGCALSAQPRHAVRRRAAGACKARRSGGDDAPNVAERIVAALPYVLPLLDGLRYSRFFFLEFPQAKLALLPFQPLLQLYTTVPFASVIVFFGLYLGIVNNQAYSRFVRFNGQQAILLDILLILPSLLENLFRMPSSGFGLNVYISLYNTVWLFVAFSFLYAVGACLAGKKVLLPLVGDGADQQVM